MVNDIKQGMQNEVKLVRVNSAAEINLATLSGLLASVGMRRRSRARMQAAIATSSDVFAAYSGGDLVGFGRLVSDNAYYGAIWDLVVRPDLQDYGIGSEILSTLLRRARARRLVMVGLFTASHNKTFYERHGFEFHSGIRAMTRFPKLSAQGEIMTVASAYSIVAAEYNKPLIDGMITVVLEEFKTHDLTLARILRVPGCYELPITADMELAKPDVAGLVVLGYIERGETLHGEVMGHVVHRSLVELQLKVKKPIGLGIIGPGATEEQALVRQSSCAKNAVYAVKQVADILQSRESVDA
jgi:6,7-dimethyl-8-ribityllumazine synthase